jgi:hypothetical protein
MGPGKEAGPIETKNGRQKIILKLLRTISQYYLETSINAGRRDVLKDRKVTNSNRSHRGCQKLRWRQSDGADNRLARTGLITVRSSRLG